MSNHIKSHHAKRITQMLSSKKPKDIVKFLYSELKNMNFMNKERCNAYLIIYIIVFTIIFSFLYIIKDENKPEDYAFGGDFILFWAASKQLIHGHIYDIYNTAAHDAVMQSAHALSHPYKLPFLYPPSMLFFIWPWAFFTYTLSYTLWSLTAPFITAKTLSILCRNWSITAFAFVSPQFCISLVTGQTGLLIALILTLGFYYIEKNPFVSGLFFGLLIIKPHVAFLVPLGLIFMGRWRTIIGMMTSAICMVGLSLCVFGLDAWIRFFEYSHMMQDSILHNVALCQIFITLFGFLSVHHVPFSTALWLQIIFSSTIIMFVFYKIKKGKNIKNNLILCLTASPLCTPYLLHYDLTYMMIPAIWMINTAIETKFLPWEKLLLIVLYFSPFYILSLTLHYHMPIEPIIALIFLYVASRRHSYLEKNAVQC